MKEIWLAVIPATIPTLAVLVGILLNQNSANRLDAKIDRLEARLNDRIDHLEARIDTLSKQLNDAILMLMGRDTDKSERLARLEERSKG
jgi:division protein CdvB (Snf7/Vps24/ESCRT-III family)